eukprot:CAMPEP_0197194360 /NCGR_PEP_ID=MMETSP1423-20130617/29121_1 /TAXON_ID=476441 /ORGANISM="Pseudo-nitzschia heimii, Strain UNC1101" /LENGTH=199 /DNA_ID=CAMNT_0042647777 /DNA_START=65 /DNA_END=660 /DNA_ORIENTATION=-
MAMIVTIMKSLLPVSSLVDESIALYDGNDDTSDFMIGKLETKKLAAKGARVDGESDDCVDDPDFLYKGKTCVSFGKNRKGKRRKQKKSNKKRNGKHGKQKKRKTANKLKVGVYYYPWWAGDFHRGNPSNPDLYLRRQLISPKQLPELGEYDDREPSVIAEHLRWSREHNVDLWVTSWWGKDKREDKNIKENILTHPDIR